MKLSRFSTSQRNGALTLFIFILLISSTKFVLEHYFFTAPTLSLQTSQLPILRKQISGRVPDGFILKINQADSAGWRKIPGIGPILSQRIVNFRKAIGGFKEISDLEKVYGISEEQFTSMLPYLVLDSVWPNRNKKATILARNIITIDINTADSILWEQLPGIGEILSSRIIKYRRAINGFTEINQLRSVFGLSEETYEQIEPFLKLDSIYHIKLGPTIVHLDINTADSIELENLPLIGPVLSSRIIKYRKSIGGFDSLQSIKKVFGMSEETYEVIKTFFHPDPQTIPEALHNQASEKTNKQQFEQVKRKVVDLVPININTADEIMLDSVPGIGKVMAKRIVSFRRLIGYYADLSYLKSIYGMTDENYQRMLPYLYINQEGSTELLDINMLSLKKLKYYPFLKDSLAERLYHSRRKLGHFSDWEEIAELDFVNADLLRQIKLYFKM